MCIRDSINCKQDGTSFHYRYVDLVIDTKRRTAELTVKAPSEKEPSRVENLREKGSDLWALRCFRELDDALLRLRLQFLDIGMITLKAKGEDVYKRQRNSSTCLRPWRHLRVAPEHGRRVRDRDVGVRRPLRRVPTHNTPRSQRTVPGSRRGRRCLQR